LKSRYFIKISFRGTHYHGWQVQPNAPTVQEILNRDLSLLLGEEISTTGCGRTDAGVHAREFFAHFDARSGGLGNDAEFLHRLNGKLPWDIAAREIRPVTPEAHARFDALSRTYEYHLARQKEVFQREFAHYVYGKLNLEIMQEGCGILREYTDFTSFSKADTDTGTNDCRIREARWETAGSRWIFTVTADRFLRNMVRAIVGTLLDLGSGKITPGELRKIIESKDRSDAGASAPAKGLFLCEVSYPAGIFLDGMK
jgi:tRNA pseudouridine38-40 synthase